MSLLTESWAAEIVELPGGLRTERIFAALYADQRHAFWLDSSRQAYQMGQWSFLGAPTAGALRVWQTKGQLWCQRAGRTWQLNTSLLSALGDHLARRKVAEGALPFLGGVVGYLGYGFPGLGSHPRPDPRGPDAHWWEITQFIAHDHGTDSTYAVLVGPAGPRLQARASAWADAVTARLAADPGLPPCSKPPAAIPARASVNRVRYLRDLAEVRSWLLAGDSYEACYTYQLFVPRREPSWLTYRRLRVANPAPYSSYLAIGDRQILSSSPERFLRVEPSGWAETKPIKGTMTRGATPLLDRQLSAELAQDPKSLSENLMIVDLLRNDLTRICHSGTVAVPDLMSVESYATVHQLVTTVRGKITQLRPDYYLPSLFPGGSMTGAPKKRTVELLDALEAQPRGVYSGILGYFSYTAAADLAIVIRTAVIDGDAVHIGTGGAITIKSDPLAEYRETKDKAEPLLRIFPAVHPDEIPAANPES